MTPAHSVGLVFDIARPQRISRNNASVTFDAIKHARYFDVTELLIQSFITLVNAVITNLQNVYMSFANLLPNASMACNGTAPFLEAVSCIHVLTTRDSVLYDLAASL